ncbi:MAG TPA: hypothetical protein VK816_10095 [Jatrophihabitantaceae bacterium]|jgi:hypothetical protein|nr:hypothetical protein [Jatrophihabitantaceae bacterium]
MPENLALPADDAPRCSARGCRNAATVELGWRNPSLHDGSRVKIWMACADHADHLAEFLSRRGFLLTRTDQLTDS